jgi:transposase
MDRAALEQLSKDALIDLLLAQEARHAAELAVLREQNAALLARIDALERRLGLDSSNSSKPPSSDGLKKKPPLRTRSLRGKSGKARGGQVGHPGSTLNRSETPDTTIDHYPVACGGCGAPLTATASTGHRARQVFDLPEPLPLLVTEHRAHECQCAACGAKTQAAFPEGVNAPVQYGARIMSFVIYLLHFQLLPEKRLVMLMADLFSVFLSPGTISNMSRACAARMGIFAQAVCDRVCAAPVKHLDETGFRIGGKLRWLHVASTRLLTFYRCRKKRGDMLAKLTGIIVHDHWKSYFKLKGVQHALCNAHHLRELKALIEIEKETWAKRCKPCCGEPAMPQISLAHRTKRCRLSWLRLSNAAMTRPSRKAWRSTMHCHLCTAKPSPEKSPVDRSRAGSDTICWDGCKPTRKTCCASSQIQPCRSAIILQKAISA